MKKVNSKKELLEFLGNDYDTAYDIDMHCIMMDTEYAYPIWIDYRGTTDLGESYKVYSKNELLELKKIFDELL